MPASFARPIAVPLAAVLIPMLAVAAFAAHDRVLDRIGLALREWRDADRWQGRAIWLPDYRAVVQARPIAGLTADVSALTYDPDRRTLFTVTNSRPELIELSLAGKVLRRIQLRGFSDPEAIEYVGRNTYVVTDERLHRLLRIELTNATSVVEAAHCEQLSIAIDVNGNKGLEGLAYDRANDRLYAAREREPRIYEIRGFAHPRASAQPGLHVTYDPERDAGLFMRDLSSLDFDSTTGHLLALSHESRLLLELDAGGTPISSLSLAGGDHGLERDVPQAEGVALDDERRLYVVSEPNLFYVFARTGAGFSAPFQAMPVR